MTRHDDDNPGSARTRPLSGRGPRMTPPACRGRAPGPGLYMFVVGSLVVWVALLVVLERSFL